MFFSLCFVSSVNVTFWCTCKHLGISLNNTGKNISAGLLHLLLLYLCKWIFQCGEAFLDFVKQIPLFRNFYSSLFLLPKITSALLFGYFKSIILVLFSADNSFFFPNRSTLLCLCNAEVQLNS